MSDAEIQSHFLSDIALWASFAQVTSYLSV